MKRIVIIGGGFAGLSAVFYLLKHKRQAEIILIDKKAQAEFLPLLPDVLSERVDDQFLSVDLVSAAKRLSFKFINSSVTKLKLENKRILLTDEEIGYDYLIIACGSKTNFYSQVQIQAAAFKLDDVSDAKSICCALKNDEFKNFIVSGGGYTGIEIATNICKYFSRKGLKRRIIIIEKAAQLLAMQPDWMRKYAADNLADLGVEVRFDCQIESYVDKKAVLKGGESFAEAALIWAAGVKGRDFINSAQAEYDRQGRAVVDEYLRLNNNCFCCGDAAHFEHKGTGLRMSVQFSIMQGRLAAANIIKSMNEKKLKRYEPVDLGYIIPMDNNIACGIVLGFNIKGRFAVIMHYFMCVFRSYSLRNRLGIIKNLLKIL